MTLQFAAGESWSLQSSQFGVNEILSALVLGKSIGSLVTRQHDASIFRHLQSTCHAKVRRCPKWLMNFQFARSTALFGSNMRLIKDSEALLMNDITISTLEGFAAVIVLCACYTSNLDAILQMVEEMILGTMTKFVDPGDLQGAKAKLYTPWKPLLRTWIQGILSSDASSAQRTRVVTLLAELTKQGASVKLSNNFARTRYFNLDLVADLLGAEDTRGGQWGESIATTETPAKQRVFDTVSVGTASIGLAAAANGADVSILCISKHGRMIIPSGPNNATLYLIRLWLQQPPPYIYQHLRPFSDRSDGVIEEGGSDDYGLNIVHGGEQEIALNIARELNFWSEDYDMVERVMALWNAGLKKGREKVWVVKPFKHFSDEDSQVATSPHLKFQLQLSPQPEVAGLHVDLLASHLFRGPKNGLWGIRREVANIIHDMYGLADYVGSRTSDMAFFDAAKDFILIAMAIGCLETLIKFPANNPPNCFAFNLGSLTRRGIVNAAGLRTGELKVLLPHALGEAGVGVSHNELLWCVALVWGGASFESQGSVEMNERVLGLVAPQCTVILDFIRDPISLARDGLNGKLISIHRGAVPLLGQDPKTGFVMAQSKRNRRLGTSSLIDGRSFRTKNSNAMPFCEELVLTFEADFTAVSTNNLFIGWHGGEMAFELDPKFVFDNLLMRRFEGSSRIEGQQQSILRPVCELSDVIFPNSMELISMGDLIIENCTVVFNTDGDFGWVVACAGSVLVGNAVIQLKGAAPALATVRDFVILC